MRGFIVGSVATGLLLLGLMELGGEVRAYSQVSHSAFDSGVVTAAVLRPKVAQSTRLSPVTTP
jgi:hypothetical protein